MITRGTAHILILSILGIAGVWLTLNDAGRPFLSAYEGLGDLATPMYWFAYLVFVFVSTLLFFILIRMPPTALLIAYLLAALTGAIATAVVVNMGKHDYLDLTPAPSSPPLVSMTCARANVARS
ncbi:MAG: hypothetical protein ACR2RB_17830 [Gammaproteobacteria bacterium]